jgi:hypothetical protein
MDFPPIDEVAVPQHLNFQHRGETLYWAGSDNLERYQTNCKSSTKKQLLDNLGFTDTNITYRYNSYGFREEEFDHRPCGMAFGCSHTEGVGLPVENAWPRVLSNLTETWVWNFGVSGSSLDTVFRLLDFWLPYFNPKFVVVCAPEISRVEVFDHDNPTTLLPGAHEHEDRLKNFYKVWASSDNNMDITRRKNLLAIEKMCNDRDTHLIVVDSLEIYRKATTLARDLMHSGVLEHSEFAEKIKEKL